MALCALVGTVPSMRHESLTTLGWATMAVWWLALLVWASGTTLGRPLRWQWLLMAAVPFLLAAATGLATRT